jgi:Helix-turn-helix domain
MTTDEVTARYLAKYLAKTTPTPRPGLLDRDGLITTTELATFPSVPVKTLRQWRYLGVGPAALRVGRHVRYEPSEVRRWLSEDCSGELTA